MDLRLIALLATAGVALMSLWPAQAAATHVNCGDTITQDTKLDNDLINCPSDGIVIGADSITLDLGGHTILGQGHPTEGNPGFLGVNNQAAHDGVTVENGVVRGFLFGIEFDGASHSLIREIRTLENEDAGIAVDGGDGNVIEKNS